MRNALIAALVAAAVASAGAGAYTAPTNEQLDTRVMYLEEQVASLSLAVQNNRATLARATRQVARCMAKPEASENTCTARWFTEGRAP